MRRAVLSFLALGLAGAGLLAVGSPASAGAGSTDWKQVSAGALHTCATTTGSELFCWGSDGDGQLGNGAGGGSVSPVAVAGSNWKQVSAGDFHTCATTTGDQLYCWGRNADGQLAALPGADVHAPIEIGGTNWAQVGAGGAHTCGVKTNSRLLCWGDDAFGQVGDGSLAPICCEPREVAGSTTNWKRVSAGLGHTCGTRTNGRLYCFGNDGNGQVGVDGFGEVNAPVQVAGNVKTWTKVDTGDATTCAIRKNKRAFCFGSDADGQLGNDEAHIGTFVPAQLAGNLKVWTEVAAGAAHGCARKSSGRLFCWGHNGEGQHGTGLDNSGVPLQVTGALTTWKRPAAGGLHSCALQTSGRLFCWGDDEAGQVGNGGGMADTLPTPTEVAGHP